MSDVIVNDRIVIPARELTEAFVRSSGPGGQNVNKVASKVELRWTPATSEALGDVDRARILAKLHPQLTAAGELIVTSDKHRDQVRNRGDARDKLAAIVRGALARPKTRRPTRPTRGSRERRIGGKKLRGGVKKLRRPPDD